MPNGWESELERDLRNELKGYLSPGLLKALGEIDPPLNNMGGTYPVTPLNIPHYEKELEKLVDFETLVDTSRAQKTILDFLGFSFMSPVWSPKLAENGEAEAGCNALEYGLKSIWPDVSLVRSPVGMRGYPMCKAIMSNGQQLGLIGYGAKHGRDSVSLPGQTCQGLGHENLVRLIEIMRALDARLSRVDIALDMCHGETTWDHAWFCYNRGDFKHPKSPCNPGHKIVESGRDGVNLGRTLYVGARTGGVMARIYEKGLELFSRLPEEYRQACTERESAYYRERGLDVPAGTIADTWLRVEVEFKRRDDKELDFCMLTNRDVYFAGSYNYCADRLGETDGLRPKAMKTEEQIQIDKLIAEMRRSYGNTVFSLTQLGFTPDEIVQFVSTGLHNQRLVKSGLLRLIENDERWKEAMRQHAMASVPVDDSDIPF